MNSALTIDTTSVENDFYNHLNSDNQRILFSAPFGSGKTTFLESFFKNYSKTFTSLSIFPVNYSVASNDDVFELIKYDLAIQLMGKYSNEIYLTKDDFSILLSSQMYLLKKNNYIPLLTSILNLTDKIGISASSFLKALTETITDFKKFKEENSINERQQIFNYLKSVEEKGGAYEYDDISKLINTLLGRIKSNDTERKTVLIIDDLDRLDPEHIFRLFNVFSAHNDPLNNTNKFGFEKVIFVCDVINIRKIYHHKYGVDVDFSGYIDKFYSKRVYYFDIRKFIGDKIFDLVSLIPFKNSNNNSPIWKPKKNANFLVLEYLIKCLIEVQQLNLRMLIQHDKIEFKNILLFTDSKLPPQDSLNFEFLLLIQVMRSFYTELDILENKLKILSISYKTIIEDQPEKFYQAERVENLLMEWMLPFIVDKSIGLNVFNTTINYDETYYYSYSSSIIFQYRLRSGSQRKVYFHFLKATSTKAEDGIKIPINIFEILYETFKICRRNRYIM